MKTKSRVNGKRVISEGPRDSDAIVTDGGKSAECGRDEQEGSPGKPHSIHRRPDVEFVDTFVSN